MTVATAFDHLLPAGVVVVEAHPRMWESGLLPEEARFVAAAAPRRRREFTAGRNCARSALEALGIPPQPILVGKGRAPVFPPRITGSITHTESYCAAAAARRDEVGSIGIDAEAAGTFEPGVGELICTPQELSSAAAAAASREFSDKVVFSAKESLYKAVNQVLEADLWHLDVAVELHPAGRRFSIEVMGGPVEHLRGARFEGRYALDAHRVYTAVVLPRTKCIELSTAGRPGQ